MISVLLTHAILAATVVIAPPPKKRDSEVSQEDRDEILAFIDSHDHRFEKGDIDGLLELYSQDFLSDITIPVLDRDKMGRLYANLYSSMPPRTGPITSASEPRRPSTLRRIRKLGDYFAVEVCTEFGGGSNPEDHSCQLFLMNRKDEQLQVSRLYQIDHDSPPTLSGDGQTYKNDEFLYSLNLPPDYMVLQPTNYSGRYIDRLKLVGADLSTEITIGLLPPKCRQDLEHLIRHDSRHLKGSCRSFESTGRPARLPNRWGEYSHHLECDIEITDKCPLGERTCFRGHNKLCRVYLSPDERAVFIFMLTATKDRFRKAHDDMMRLTGSLSLNGRNADYWTSVASRQGWGKLDRRGRFSNPKLGLTFRTPKNWIAEIVQDGMVIMEPSSSRRHSTYMRMSVEAMAREDGGDIVAEYKERILSGARYCSESPHLEMLLHRDRKISSTKGIEIEFRLLDKRQKELGHHHALLVPRDDHILCFDLHAYSTKSANKHADTFKDWIGTVRLK